MRYPTLSSGALYAWPQIPAFFKSPNIDRLLSSSLTKCIHSPCLLVFPLALLNLSAPVCACFVFFVFSLRRVASTQDTLDKVPCRLLRPAVGAASTRTRNDAPAVSENMRDR